MATLAEFRSYVRTHIDLDASDLPDELLDEFIREGSKLIQYKRSRWTFYQDLWTLTTVPDQATYTFASLANDNDYVLAEIRDFIRDSDGDSIQFAGEGVVRDAATGSKPERFYLWGTTITLDPTPSTAETYTVVGYREPVDWVSDGAGASPDTPAVFDGVIRQWALGKAYAHQEESATSVFFLDSANFELERLTMKLDDFPPGRIVINSDGLKHHYWQATGTMLSAPRIVT